MRNVISSIEAEYRKYKRLGELAIGQLRDAELGRSPAPGGNSVASLVRHLAGNLKSRFTEFLTTDGEKPWRNKEREFGGGEATGPELMEEWNEGWSTLFRALEALTDEDLSRPVTIAGEPHRVDQALHRSLAHAGYHVGQIVYMAKATRGPEWRDLKALQKSR